MAAVVNINGRIKRKSRSCTKQNLIKDEIWLSSDISG